MEAPAISVVLAYYNPGRHLRTAVESVLAQSYPNFELILIDDGSTDGSRDSVNDLNDPRIRHIDNGKNLGLIESLNRGLQLARGKFIARMDGDDICHLDRFRRQVDFLDTHPEADMVATRVELVDEQGEPIGHWAEDTDHVTSASIRRGMPRNNCIAHPSVMARAEVIRGFGYRSEQKGTEDYDLWLRWLAEGRTIHKLEARLLQHRIVASGVTRNRQRNVALMLAQAKWRFLTFRVRTSLPGPFELRTFLWMTWDVLMGVGKELYRLFRKG